MLSSSLLEDQPFFDPARIRQLVDRLASVDAIERTPYGELLLFIARPKVRNALITGRRELQPKTNDASVFKLCGTVGNLAWDTSVV